MYSGRSRRGGFWLAWFGSGPRSSVWFGGFLAGSVVWSWSLVSVGCSVRLVVPRVLAIDTSQLAGGNVALWTGGYLQLLAYPRVGVETLSQGPWSSAPPLLPLPLRGVRDFLSMVALRAPGRKWIAKYKLAPSGGNIIFLASRRRLPSSRPLRGFAFVLLRRLFRLAWCFAPPVRSSPPRCSVNDMEAFGY